MKVGADLYSSSLFTVAGTAEGIELVTQVGTADYDWIAYVTTSLLDNQYWRSTNTQPINGQLLNVLYCKIGTIMDLESKGYAPNHLALGGITSRYEYLKGNCKGFKELHAGSDNPALLKGSPLITPFMGVGTTIPSDVTEHQLASAVAICKSPSATYVSLVGDAEGAQQLLGLGLERLRGIILDYLGIIPGPTSIPLDTCIPFVWGHSPSTPTMLSILQAQTTGDKDLCLLGKYQYRACVYTAALLYNIVESDHEYLGLDPLREAPLRHWYLSSSTSETAVPYRYPLLVQLLYLLHKYTKFVKGNLEDIKPKKLEITVLINQWGSDCLFNFYSVLMKSAHKDSLLYTNLPSIVRAFFVQLYRLTCRDVIKFPSRKDFPRRKEASKTFAHIFDTYKGNSSLSSYLDLGDVLLSNCVVTAATPLRTVCSVTDVKAYDALLAGYTLPPIPVTGTVTPQTVPILYGYKKFYRRMTEWTTIRVVNELGIEMSVTDQIRNVTNKLLDSLEDTLNTDSNKYSLVTIETLDRMVNYGGFGVDDISARSIQTTFMSKVILRKGCVNGRSLESIIDYHICLNHNATRMLLEMVCKLLESSVMSTYLDSPDMFDIKYAKRALRLCVLEYLRAILNSSRV